MLASSANTLNLLLVIYELEGSNLIVVVSGFFLLWNNLKPLPFIRLLSSAKSGTSDDKDKVTEIPLSIQPLLQFRWYRKRTIFIFVEHIGFKLQFSVFISLKS